MRISAHLSSKEMSGDFAGHAASLGLGFVLYLVENSLFCVISFYALLQIGEENSQEQQCPEIGKEWRFKS